METVNRGWLKRQVVAGKMQVKCAIKLTDDFAGDAANNFGKTGWMPAIVGDKAQAGSINIYESNFKTKSGSAWREGDTIHLCVHSNLYYEFREVAK